MKKMNIKEWTEVYFRHKDLFEKSLDNIKEEENHLILEYKNRKDVAILRPVFDDSIFEELHTLENKYDKKFIVCSKASTNVEFLIKNWKRFLIKKLVIIFVDIITNNKILINTYLHNMVSDTDKLDISVKTLFANQ